MLFADDVVIDPTAAWIPVVTAIAIAVGFVSQIILQIMAKIEAAKVAKLLKAESDLVAKSANLAAQEAKAVKESLAATTATTNTKLDSLTTVTNTVHDLVNSASIIQLKLYVNALQRIAARDRSPDDIKEADIAVKELHLRQEAQAIALAATADKS